VIERASPDVARALILEYASSLGVDLAFQHIEEELATLPDFYEAMFVADDAAGFVALRRIDAETCEMKRLYVRAEFRGRDLGRSLALHVIDEARSRGYKRMRLDTLPTMQSAMSLYRSLGFVEIEPYRFNPVEGSKYMELTIAP
jgi:ribosomal protein S18 acetylase RimI-like enzyme